MIPYHGQLRYAGLHELSAYAPSKVTGAGATLDVAATTDPAVDWENVLVASTPAGVNAYLEYGLQIREHGNNDPLNESAGGLDTARREMRWKDKLRIRPGAALAAGQYHYFAAALNNQGVTQFRVGVHHNGTQVVFSIHDVANGTHYDGATPVTIGAWYEVDVHCEREYLLRLAVRPAGGAWATEIEPTLAIPNALESFHALQIGSLGASSTSTGTWVVEFHSRVWAFEEIRHALVSVDAANYVGRASNASLQGGDTDFWIAGWGWVDPDVLSTAELVSKWDSGAEQREFHLVFQGSTGAFRFTVSPDGTGPGSSSINSSVLPQFNRWYFLCAWRSATDGKLYLSVDGGPPVSVAFVGPAFEGPAPWRFGQSVSNGASVVPFTGRLGYWAWGKAAAGTLAESSGNVDTLLSTLYGAGSSVDYKDLSESFKTTFGLVSFWTLSERAGQDRMDLHGGNHLTETGTVDSTPGVRPVFDPTDAAVRFDAEEFVASRIADVSPTAAAPRLLYRAGQWRGVTHARIVVATDPGLAGATAGAWTPVAAASAGSAYALELPDLTGLAPDTVHYYRWELSRDGATAHVQSDVRRFRTLPAVGTAAALQQHVWSCNAQWSAALPARELGNLLDQREADSVVLHRSVCLGDLYYEWAAETPSAGAETVDDFVREMISSLYDPHLARLVRSAALVWMPSDHEVCNNVDSRARTSPTVRATTMAAATTATGAEPQADYSAGRTIGEVWDAASVLIEYWCWRPWLTTPAAGTSLPEASGTLKHGRVMEVRLDVRYTDRNAAGYASQTAVVIGSGPGTLGEWFAGVVAAFNADPDADLLVVFTEGPITRIDAGTTDSWIEIAPAEAKAVLDMIAATVTAPEKRVLFVCGDRHSVFWADRYFESATPGVVLGEPLALNLGASGLGSSYLRGADGSAQGYDGAGAAYVMAYYDGARHALPASGAVAKSSGAYLQIDQGAGILDAEYWSDYGTRYQPATLQGFQLLEPAAGLQTVHAAAAVDGSGTWTAVGADDEVAALGDADPATYAQGDPLAAGQSQSRTYALEDLLAPGSAGTAIAFRIGKDDAAAAQLDCTVALLDPAGDPVAGHTWTYPDLPALDDAADTSEAITAQLGAGGYQVEFTFSRP